MNAIERATRLALVLRKVRSQIPQRSTDHASHAEDIVCITLKRRDWWLVTACLSAEFGRAEGEACEQPPPCDEPIPPFLASAPIEPTQPRRLVSAGDVLGAIGFGLAVAALIGLCAGWP